jgi:uncharacterized membrane protein HdeD (DUF308 family)
MAILFAAAQLMILLMAGLLLFAVMWADPLSLVVALGMVAAVSGLAYIPARIRRRRSDYARR